MIVAHNMMAMNTQRQFNVTGLSKKKSTEKLSSGYKINRAADDAAGLTISEKMRSQIRGLNQGSDNCQDGVSFNQIADGAMSEVDDMLHRLTELSVKSANGTLTEEDRNAIQKEVSQIVEDIDRIHTSTEFNTIPVFAWDRKKYEYGKDASDIPYVKSEESYIVSGIKYGLTDIVGEDHIYNGAKLDSPLKFDGTGWHSTGDIFYSGKRTYSDIIDKIYADSAGIISKTEIENELHDIASQSNYISYTRHDSSSKTYLTLSAEANGTKDLDGRALITQVKYSTGTYDPTIGSGSEVKKTGRTFNLAEGSTGATGFDNGKSYGSAWIDFSGLGTDYILKDLVGQGFNSTCATCSNHYSIYFTNQGPDYTYTGSSSSPRLDININGCSSGEDIVNAIMTAVNNTTELDDHFTQYAYNESNPAKIYMYDNRNYQADGGDSKFEPAARNENNIIIINNSEIHDPQTGDLKSKITEGDGIWIQSGASRDDGFYIKRARIDTSFLGIDGLDVSNLENARNAIGHVNAAVEILNSQRTMVGAQQNRCEYAIKIDDNIVENTTAAESRIRDTDMASEMVKLTKENILEQAGISMMSQANQSTQGVLSLLQ